MENSSILETPAEIDIPGDDLHTFGVEPPVYTKVSKALNLGNKETGSLSSYYSEIPNNGTLLKKKV